jgi:large subunit ribosomal protein L14
MIQAETIVVVCDNTGAKTAGIIKIPGGSKRRYARVGDRVIVSIKSAAPRGTVKRRSIQKGVVVRSVRSVKRKDGSLIRFDQNAIVIINDDGSPKGTRVFGPIARELRERGYQKIVSQAPEVL